MDEPALSAPDAVYVRQRWVSTRLVEWVKQADKIMTSHGAVYGTDTYDTRHKARWRARKLIRLMVLLGLHERWQLQEHIEKRRGGWQWSVEYVGGKR